VSGAQGAVLVVGASGGIGRATCLALAALGRHVFAASRHPGDMHRDDASGSGAIVPLELDLCSDASISHAVKTMRSRLGPNRLSGVALCSGVGVSGPLELTDRETLHRLFDINVAGPLALVRATLPLLRESSGRIAVVGSTSGRIPGAFNGAYSASKFALEAVVSVLRAELNDSGVHVSIVDPGVIATQFWEKIAGSEAALKARISCVDLSRYGRHFERRRRMLDDLRCFGAVPSTVSAALTHALHAGRPRRRYVVGRDARLRLALWRLSPEWLRHRFLCRAMR